MEKKDERDRRQGEVRERRERAAGHVTWGRNNVTSGQGVGLAGWFESRDVPGVVILPLLVQCQV